MTNNRVVVELDLDETVERGGHGITPATYRVHARTRIIPAPPARHDDAPQLGDQWCPLTVRARLHRLADVFRRLPHTSDTRPAGFRSCMPEPLREFWKDQPGEPMRLGVSAADMSAAREALEALWPLTTEQRVIAWGIAARLSDRRVGRELRCHHNTAASRKLAVLDMLAGVFRRMGGKPDASDIAEATALINKTRD